jgi:hypothetical protein
LNDAGGSILTDSILRIDNLAPASSIAIDSAGLVTLAGALAATTTIKGTKFVPASVGDSSGTPGNATLNNGAGTSAIAAAASAAVITNSLVAATSLIFVTPRDTDATCVTYKAVAASGSFTVTCGAAATANWAFQWLVVN